MEIIIVIPKEFEPVLRYWEKLGERTMKEWLTEIAIGNLKPLGDEVYEQDVAPTITEKIAAVDWIAKTAAVSAKMDVVSVPEEEPIEKGVISEVEPG